MHTYIAILRGINVGGRRKILMADLKAMFAQMGYTNITTYIQSGNVIFNTAKVEDNTLLAVTIASQITETFGHDVPVIVRSKAEWIDAIGANPFYNDDTSIEHLYLTFLSAVPSDKNKAVAESYDYQPDKFVLDENNAYVYCEGKYHKSKLSNTFFEKKLKVNATTRNWKTVMKIREMLK